MSKRERTAGNARVTPVDLGNLELPEGTTEQDLLEMTTKIVMAHVGNNAVSAKDLPALIKTIFSTLKELVLGAQEETRLEPAVPIGKSITDDNIICLEDGKPLKMLKRYLRTHHGLSPEEYRARWGLPADYPMVAPEYARRRSAMAKKNGLGKRGRDHKSGGKLAKAA